jgi:hypothetical protein
MRQCAFSSCGWFPDDVLGADLVVGVCVRFSVCELTTVTLREVVG